MLWIMDCTVSRFVYNGRHGIGDYIIFFTGAIGFGAIAVVFAPDGINIGRI